ncbi:class A sortase [Enterococcus mundtii]|uniref:Sortase n=1 Tax=Enterococcus mundtii TaxID=53346 RepID=A0A1V2UEX2_ENTMU|nr:class A sortase [Enterococcus mundtii]ONN41881.1 sortase [Enterococcus mundtii]
MKKWIIRVLGVALIVFFSVFGYVSYQKHEGEVFKQNIEKIHVDQINTHANIYKDDTENVNNDMSLGQMLSIQKKAIEMGVNQQAFGQIQIPELGLALPIFKGANQYTLSLGAATYFYEDAEMGKGNYVLAGHNMEMPGVLFSDIQNLSLGEVMDLASNDGVYRYRVTRKFIVPEYFKLIDGVPEENSFLSLPKNGEKPLLTLFTCVYTAQGKERYVVQGELQ